MAWWALLAVILLDCNEFEGYEVKLIVMTSLDCTVQKYIQSFRFSLGWVSVPLFTCNKHEIGAYFSFKRFAKEFMHC